MDTDPATNVVAFEFEGRDEPHIGSGPTRDDDCIQQVWSSAPDALRAAARAVTRVYSDWEPSKADGDFIRRTFPRAELTYSFERPEPDGWDAALAAARQALEQQASEQATQKMDYVDEHGELLPILWSQSSPIVEMLGMLPHRELVPGKLYVALATVATTPEQRIGMNHVTSAALDGAPLDDAMAEAFDSLVRGLRIEGLADPDRTGEMAVLTRQGLFACSAIALPNFYEQMSSALRADRFIVGVPDTNTVLVTPVNSGWVDEIHHLVRSSPHEAREFVPCVLALERGGFQFLAERAP
jgi:hypothetical protein